MNDEANSENPVNVCPSCGQEQLGKTNRCWKCGAVLIERKRFTPVYFPQDQYPPDLAPGEIQYSDEVILAVLITEDTPGSPSDEQKTAGPDGEAQAVAGVEPAATAHQAPPSNVPLAAPIVIAPAASYQPPQGIPWPVHQGSPFQKNPFEMSAPKHFAPQVDSVWMPGMEDYMARGGAVAAFVIGIVTILGGLITGFAFLNGILGIGLGIWGLNSTKKRMAIIGIGLCIIGMFVTLAVLIHKASSPTGPGVF